MSRRASSSRMRARPVEPRLSEQDRPPNDRRNRKGRSNRHIFRARAPLRLGLAGGGTDLSPYSDLFGGATLNVTIDRFAFASLAFRSDDQVLLRANDLVIEERHAVGNLPTDSGLALHRAVYNRMCRQFLEEHQTGLELSTWIDAPAGSGLGSSSALVVAMVEAFRTAFNLPLGLYDVAHLAVEIERSELRMAGGKQDQYAAAFGGMNFVEFLPDDRVIVNPLRVEPAILNELQCSILVCFTGQSRDSDRIIREQIKAMNSPSGPALDAMHALKQDAIDMKHALLMGDIDDLAQIMDHSWVCKQKTAHSISNPEIEALEAVARANGAKAGKISGAGGGGFMMFVVDPEDKPRLARELQSAGRNSDSVVFTHQGVESWSVSN
jgi:D-glycero-alpha-D-manno-heptose-7-phosphate kinase